MKGPATPNKIEQEALRARFTASPAMMRESLHAYINRNYVLIESELIAGRTTAQIAEDISAVRNEKVSVTNLRTYISKLRNRFPGVRANMESDRHPHHTRAVPSQAIKRMLDLKSMPSKTLVPDISDDPSENPPLRALAPPVTASVFAKPK